MGASIAPLWHGKFGLGFLCYQIPNLQETSWYFSSRQSDPNPQFFMPQRSKGTWKPPRMETANDKNVSNARWQAQGQKLLEPTIKNVLSRQARKCTVSQSDTVVTGHYWNYLDILTPTYLSTAINDYINKLLTPFCREIFYEKYSRYPLWKKAYIYHFHLYYVPWYDDFFSSWQGALLKHIHVFG